MLKPNVKAEDVHAALDRIFDLHGCRGCGLLGIDLRLLGGDPAEQQFGDVRNVGSVRAIGG